MATEPKTGLDFWPPGAMQPDLLFNAMLYWLAAWAQPVVLGFEDDPPGSPGDGDAYLVGTGTGEWTGHDNEQVRWDAESGIWRFFAPFAGYEVRNLDTGDVLIFDGSDWGAAPGGLADAPIDGTGYVRKDGGWVAESGGGRSTVTSVSSVAGVVTLDYALGDYFTLTLTENVTSWSISNPPGSGNGFTLMVQITQDSTPRTVSKPGTTAGGAALDVSTGSGDIDLLAITSFDNGSTLRSTIAKDFS